MSSVTENLLTERTYYKPFEYPWAFDYYIIQNQLHWLPEDVPMHEDVKDWNTKITPAEKNLLTQIFRLFTQSMLMLVQDIMKNIFRCLKSRS